MNEVPSFGLWLKQRRKGLGLTQPGLALRVACSTDTIDKIEAGKRRPSEQMAARLAECLGIDTTERQAFIEYARLTCTAGKGLLHYARNARTSFPQAIYAPWRNLHQPANNLPAPPNAFIGRTEEVEAVCALLARPGVRLLTLTGPPGIGKTRLALRVATALLNDFSDGVFFVPLAPIRPITDPSLVISAIAKTLRVREAPNLSLLDSLQSYLQDKHLLLLLDNFEQVAQAAPLVSQLLQATPELAVLCTSRIVLHLYGEHEFEVPSLALPPVQLDKQYPLVAVDLDRLAQYEAVRLFIERAQAAKSDFALTNENAPSVVEICRHLDGLPLAIEFAAARIKLLSPQAILVRLSSRLDLLTGGAQDLPARQQTLRNAIEWSYDLLSDDEKQLFRRLSVFVGGCTLQAVQAVALGNTELRYTTDSIESLPVDMLNSAGSLVDNSLLRQEEDLSGEPRFWMLETIREYAWEHLQESGESEAIRRCHADYFLALVEEARSALQGPDLGTWLERLETEHDNLRTALQYALESGQIELGLRISGALWHFWYRLGDFSEGHEWLGSFLSRMEEQRGERQGSGGPEEAQEARGPQSNGKQQQKQKAYETPALAEAFLGAGTLACRQEDLAAAHSYFKESLTIYRRLGEKRGSAKALNGLGIMAALRADYEIAHAFYKESLAIRRELEDKGGIACSLTNLGEMARCQGDYTAAHAFFEESLATWRELGDRYSTGMLLHNLGQVALCLHDTSQATTLFAESLEIAQELGNKYSIAECLEGLAGVAAAMGQAHRAARLFGAAEALRKAKAIRDMFSPADRMEYAQHLADAQAQLDASAWQTAWEEGTMMDLEQAIGYALNRRREVISPAVEL